MAQKIGKKSFLARWRWNLTVPKLLRLSFSWMYSTLSPSPYWIWRIPSSLKALIRTLSHADSWIRNNPHSIFSHCPYWTWNNSSLFKVLTQEISHAGSCIWNIYTNILAQLSFLGYNRFSHGHFWVCNNSSLVRIFT